MKRNLLTISILTCAVFFYSCNDESGEIETVVPELETQEISPIPLDELESRRSAPGFTDSRTAAASSAMWQHDPDDGESYFYREGNKVKEKSWRNGVVFTFSIWIEDDGVFVYLNDASRNFHMALPTWNAGNYAPSWIWDTGAKKWVQWRRFRYNPCTSDREAPKVTHNSCRVVGREAQCDVISSFHWDFPDEVPDMSQYLYAWYGLTDNCDSDLTIRQFPAPGSTISAPKQMAVEFDIIDNNGNSLGYFFLVNFRRYPSSN